MSYLKINVSIELPMPSDPMSSDSMIPESSMRLGCYLIEAGLITPAQVSVVLNDQNINHDMRFGEVLVARGWIKPETIDFVMKYAVEPSRRASQYRQQSAAQAKQRLTSQSNPLPQSLAPSSAHSQASSSVRSQAQTPTEIFPQPVTPKSTTPPRTTTPPHPIAYAQSVDGNFQVEILDDGLATMQLIDPPKPAIYNDRKSLPSISDESGVNWAG